MSLDKWILALDIKTFDITDVPQSLVGDWGSTCESSIAHGSPFFHPNFMRCVASVRPGVRVAVVSEDGKSTGFFCFEVGKNGRGRPVAGRLSDFQGIISDKPTSLTARELLEACSLRSLSFDHWVAEQPLAAKHGDAVYDSPFLDLSQGYESFLSKRTGQGSTRLKKVGQLSRKLMRECGNAVFSEHDEDPKAFEHLLAWKSQQYQRTGALDIFKYHWVLDILKRVVGEVEGGFCGRMMTYRVAGQIVAVHLGMQTRSTVHWWFPAFDPAFGKYSPGLLMLAAGAEHFAGMGVQRLDLGRGDESFKRSVTLDARMVAEGELTTSRVRRFAKRGTRALWQTLRRIPGKSYIKRTTAFMHRLNKHNEFR